MIATPHGRALLLALDDADAATLHPAELAHAATLPELRRREFIAGRAALRALIGPCGPILSDDLGAPLAPAGFAISVSHKGALAAALVASDDGARIGLNLERAVPSRLDIASRILTPREQAALPDRGRAVTLRFAIKEAIYKAVAPFVRRYVGFTEVELEVHDDGRVTVTPAPPLALEIALEIEATWRELDGHWLATARGSHPTNETSRA